MKSTPDSNAQPRISVAICAHNAAGFLTDVINSVMTQSLPTEQYEVLLIDNNSTDGTREITQQLCQTHGRRLRVFTESRQGLSHARNRALAEASAPLVAFIDVDSVAHRGWLKSILATFDEHPRAGVVGGRIDVQWDAPRPPWWDDRLDEAMGRFCPGERHTILKYPQYSYGGNFAVRMDAIEQVGVFVTNLGRRGRELLAGEEGELCLRMEKSEWEIHYIPQAVVHHRATANRLTRRFILRRAFNHGRSQYLLESMHSFESGLYLSWPEILWNLLNNGVRLNWKMPYLKYLFFRMGYQYQRTQTRSRGLRQRRAHAPFRGRPRDPRVTSHEPQVRSRGL